MATEEVSEWQGQFDPFSDPDEKAVVLGTLDSFRSYRHIFHRRVTHVRRQSFYALPAAHWELLAEPPFSVLDSFNAVDDAIDANADLAEAIFRVGLQSFGLSEDANEETPPEDRMDDGESKDRKPIWHGKANDSAMEKARSTIRQIFRDWSAEGAVERAACYNPILEALSKEYAHIPDPQKDGIKVLVPGAGLGRLMVEICCAGYSVEGNEISYHQLMASSFILNHTQMAEQFALYPWALQFSNHRSRAHQFQKVMVPDIHPATALGGASNGMETHAFERMSMTASDFCVSYREDENNKDSFDAVTTCFFIDTAPNLINYIETIRHCLKTGGVWINLGPLLWHFENDTTWSKRREESNGQNPAIEEGNRGIDEPGSVELTDEEVVRLVERFGFKIEKHSSGEIEAGYIANPQGMLRNVYQPSFWIARKQ